MRKKPKSDVKKLSKFGVLDVVIILLVIIAIVGVYFRYNILEFVTNTRDLKDYTVNFSIDNIRYTTPNFIDIGDEVYFADNDELLGTLISASENMGALSITPASEMFTATNGDIIEVFYPNSESRISATGRLICKGRYSDSGEFLVNGSSYIALGQSVNVKTEFVTVTIRIDNISITESE